MIFVLGMGATMAALTWFIGWWGVPLAAATAGFLHFREGGGGWRVALAGAAAWGALLLADAGSLGAVAQTLAGVLRLPAPALLLLTVLFPAIVAWSAATCVAGARQLVTARRRHRRGGGVVESGRDGVD